MRIDSIETLAGALDGDHVVLRQSFSSSARRLRDSVIMACGIILALPIAAILANAGGRQLIGEMIVSNPTAILLLGISGLIALIAVVSGALCLSRSDISQRTVAIDPDGVIVEEIIRGRALRWREAMSGYRGIRHKVATTSGGARHVLMLEHDMPARTIHLACEPYISEAHVVEAANRFGLPVLKPVNLSQSSIWMRVLTPFAVWRRERGSASDDLACA